MPRLRDRIAAARTGWRTGTTPRRPASPALANPARHTAQTAPPKLDKVQLLTAFCGLCSVIVLALGLISNHRSTVANQQAAQMQLDLSRRDQAAKRFSDAYAQLTQQDQRTNDHLGLRAGAVQSLGQLLQDSPEYQARIVEILSTFLRTHATGRLRKDALGAWISSPPDVVAAVRVLAARPDDPRHPRLDISGARLSLPSVHLEGGRLAGADLDGAILAKAHLGGADLSDARLTFANLRKADLHDARLRGANLSQAHLTGANLAGADLRGTDLSSARVSGDDLSCAQIDQTTKLPPAVTLPSPDADGCRGSRTTVDAAGS
jgi:pentapeptide repeat protein